MYIWTPPRYVAPDVMTPLADASFEIWHCRSWEKISMAGWWPRSSLRTSLKG